MTNAPRRALYGKLAGDTTLNALLGSPAPNFSKSVYYQYAPQGSSFAYVILSKQAGTPRYSLANLAFDNDIWLVKGVDRNSSADNVDAIAARIDALLTDASLSVSGKTQLYLRRESDVDYAETVDGETYRHAGASFRFVYQ